MRKRFQTYRHVTVNYLLLRDFTIISLFNEGFPLLFLKKSRLFAVVVVEIV